MNTFTIVMINHNNRPFLNETIYATTKDAINDIAAGQIEAEDIYKIVEINLEVGTSRDVTSLVALEVWQIFDANNDYVWKEMRDWLESFDLDCEHLTGETGDLARDFYGR